MRLKAGLRLLYFPVIHFMGLLARYAAEYSWSVMKTIGVLGFCVAWPHKLLKVLH